MGRETIPEAAWIDAAKDGDVAALEMLLLWYYDRVSIHIQRQLSGHDLPRFDAEDIVQQTHHKIFRSMDQFRGSTPTQFLNWILSICDSTLADNRKLHNTEKRSGHRIRFSLDQFHHNESSASFLWEALQSQTESPSSIAVSKEELERLESVLQHLTREENELIQLRYIEQRSSQDVAARIGISGATVLRRCQATLRRIRQLLKSSD